MVQKLIKSGAMDIEAKVRALPRTLKVGDFFSGAGTFHFVTSAAMEAFTKIMPPTATEDLEA